MINFVCMVFHVPGASLYLGYLKFWVLSQVGLGANGELFCDQWLLYRNWAPVHKL